MRSSIVKTVRWLTLAAVVTGCARKNEAPRSPEAAGFLPRSPGEAQALMQAIDRQGAELGWPEAVLRNVRQGLRGRLTAAGLSEGQITEWILSKAPAKADSTMNKRENTQ